MEKLLERSLFTVYLRCFIAWLSRLIGAYRYQRPEVIVFHTDCEPYGDYWEAIRAITGKRMIVVKRSPPERVWGNEIEVIKPIAFLSVASSGILVCIDVLRGCASIPCIFSYTLVDLSYPKIVF